MSSDAPESKPPARAIIIKAVDFVGGSVMPDEDTFGIGIRVIRSPKVPAEAKFKVALPSGGEHEFWLRYASAESRPVALSINGKLVNPNACPDPTGGYYPTDQSWCKVGNFDFLKGDNTILLETTGPFPHVEKLAISPISTAR
jgi:hypothetical protein